MMMSAEIGIHLCCITWAGNTTTMVITPKPSMPGRKTGIGCRMKPAGHKNDYPIGRYIDPNDSDIMHEAHVIYRVETTAKWNLHPDSDGTVPFGAPIAVVDPAHYNAPVNAEVIAEVNKQKAATQALLNQGAELNQSLSQLAGAFQAVRQVDEQNLQLKQEMSVTQQRLDALEDKLRNKQTADSFGSNQNINTNEW